MFANNKIGLVLMTLALLASFTQALELSLNQEEYKLGDTVILNIKLKNELDQDVNWSLAHRIISKDGGYDSPPFAQKVELMPGEEKEIEISFYVVEEMPPGTYEARAGILEQENMIVVQEFEITGTKKLIEAELVTCGEEECQLPGTVFFEDGKVYAKVITELQDLEIEGTVETPLGEENLNFDGMLAPIPIQGAGDYKVTVTLSKEGYQQKIDYIRFGILESEPVKITDASKCNGDGVCSGEENYENCPQDCEPTGELTNQTQNGTEQAGMDWMLIAIIALALIIAAVIVIALVAFFIMKRRKKPETPQPVLPQQAPPQTPTTYQPPE